MLSLFYTIRCRKRCGEFLEKDLAFPNFNRFSSSNFTLSGHQEEDEDVKTPTKIESLSDVEKIAAGGTCSFALSSSGEAHAWGMATNLQVRLFNLYYYLL